LIKTKDSGDDIEEDDGRKPSSGYDQSRRDHPALTEHENETRIDGWTGPSMSFFSEEQNLSQRWRKQSIDFDIYGNERHDSVLKSSR
jgi:hypothetical protein